MSFEYWGTLPKWGMMRGGELWERITQALPTSATGSGFWRTPDTGQGGTSGLLKDGKDRRANGQPIQVRLVDQVSNPRLWPTPRTTGLDGGSNGRNAAKARGRWPMPTVNGNHNRKGASETSGYGLSTAVKHMEDADECLLSGIPPPEEEPQKMWFTPTCMNIAPSENRRKSRAAFRKKTGRQDSPGGLAEQVAVPEFWPTPRAGNPGSRPNGKGGKVLAEEVKKSVWPTPCARDWKGSNAEAGLTRNDGKSRMDQLPNAVKYATPQARDFRTGQQSRWDDADRSRNLNDQVGGQLNCDWVELLMGWPKGWTSLEPLDPDWWNRWLEHSGNHWPDGWDDGVPKLAASVPDRTARLKAIGNGQVPAAMRLAWCALTDGL